jgi:hypothetical protein
MSIRQLVTIAVVVLVVRVGIELYGGQFFLWYLVVIGALGLTVRCPGWCGDAMTERDDIRTYTARPRSLSCDDKTQVVTPLRDARRDFGKKLQGLAGFSARCWIKSLSNWR